MALITIRPTTNSTTVENCSNNNGKSIEAPTAIKNKPSNKPLNGSMSTSNSCLKSLSANTTPAKKVPSAGDKPIFCIITAIDITKNKANKVKTSRKRVSAIYLNKGAETYFPARMMAAITAIETAT